MDLSLKLVNCTLQLLGLLLVHVHGNCFPILYVCKQNINIKLHFRSFTFSNMIIMTLSILYSFTDWIWFYFISKSTIHIIRKTNLLDKLKNCSIRDNVVYRTILISFILTCNIVVYHSYNHYQNWCFNIYVYFCMAGQSYINESKIKMAAKWEIRFTA